MTVSHEDRFTASLGILESLIRAYPLELETVIDNMVSEAVFIADLLLAELQKDDLVREAMARATGLAPTDPVLELDRIQKYMDGVLVGPAPRGLCGRIDEAMRERDHRISKAHEQSERQEDLIRRLGEQLDQANRRATCGGL